MLQKTLWIFAVLFMGTYVWAQELASAPTPLTPAAVGHRGHSSIQPENTVASVKQCVKTGAHGCECDLMLTKDGKIVLFHDPQMEWKVRTDKNEKVAGVIADYDLETLRTFDFGLWKGEEFRGTKIATLDEYLDALKGTDCIPVIELKNCPPEPVVEAVKARGMEKRCVFISSSRRVKELCPEITTAVLVGDCANVPDDQLADQIEKWVVNAKTNVIDIEHSRMTPELAKELKRRHIFIMVWTVKHDPARLAELYEMGVDSITTNYPDEALDALKALSAKR